MLKIKKLADYDVQGIEYAAQTLLQLIVLWKLQKKNSL